MGFLRILKFDAGIILADAMPQKETVRLTKRENLDLGSIDIVCRFPLWTTALILLLTRLETMKLRAQVHMWL